MRYASLGTQFLVAIGIAVFFGLKTDKWAHTSPLFACILPLLTLFGLFYKTMKDTAPKKNSGKKTSNDEK
jgi:F0F1-type ATP synthase assembly protein I